MLNKQQSSKNSQPISVKLQDNTSYLNKVFGSSADFYSEPIQFGLHQGTLSYLTSMTDPHAISTKILLPLTELNLEDIEINEKERLDSLCKRTFSGTRYSIFDNQSDVVRSILSGGAILYIEGASQAISISIGLAKTRSIEEPSTQTIIRGPKDGFIEDIGINMSLIRRRIKNPALRFEQFIHGTETNTTIMLVYIDGIVNDKMLQELKQRINHIDTNAVLDSGNIEELITDNAFSPFPLIFSAERPDAIASQLVSGKVAIMVDGSPFVLALPATFADFFKVTEDYYQPFMMSTFIRLVRYLAFGLALLLPGAYVAVITYHHEIIPTPLLIGIVSQREGIPFPAVVEVMIMEITFEILREAGVRMPRAVGSTVSIVGGLVIGQAAVEAGIISNIMVIIVALTAISSFVSPIYSFSVSTRLLRFSFIIIGAFLGLYGIILGLLALIGHLVSLRSFGTPYMAPIAPLQLADQKDTLIRLPLWMMKRRPSYLQSPLPVQQPNVEKPQPPQGDDSS